MSQSLILGISLPLLLCTSWNVSKSNGFRIEAHRNHNLFHKFVKDVMKAQKTDQCDLNYVTDNIKESEISKLLANFSLDQRYIQMDKLYSFITLISVNIFKGFHYPINIKPIANTATNEQVPCPFH